MKHTNQRPRRHPLIPVALVFAAGIVADRWLSPTLATWLVVAGVFAGTWCLAASMGLALSFPKARWIAQASAGVMLLWVFCLGGARHHLAWSILSPDDISLLARDEPRLVRLRGTLADQPEIISPPRKARAAAWNEADSTSATLQCRQLLTGDADLPVCGRAALRISGHLLHAEVGDEVEICGWLALPKGSRNPGAFDPSEYLRRQGIHAIVTADHPDAVRLVREGSSLSVRRSAARVRAEGGEVFARDLSPRNAPVAAAFLYGSRSQIDEEIREAFTHSGMLHVLAISGTHVAILATLLWFVGRLIGLSAMETSLLTVLVTVGYTFLTDCRPPVVRATILVCLLASTRFWFRRAAYANGLSLAAIIVLLWNPADPFDVGAQLSFLGVLAVLWSARLITGKPDEPFDAIQNRYGEGGKLHAAASFARAVVRDGLLLSLAAALFTMPLIAGKFHIVSPISLVINLLLVPFSTLVLWFGYVHAVVGFLVPWASGPPAFLFDRSLGLFLKMVEVAADVRLSHVYVAGPPDWWLGGYYLLLFWLAFGRSARRSARHSAQGSARPSAPRGGFWSWCLLAAWTIAGLGIGLRSGAPDGVRCTFLAVGHGGAILLETPSGRTLLYDAGAIQDGRIAQRAVQSTLWDRRSAGLDVVMVSHADVDHFNGVAGLVETVPVGALLVSQQFLDFNQPAVAAVCEASYVGGVPIRLIRSGDRIRLDDKVEIRVLHPGFGPPHSDDNANSAVLLIEYAGRKVLLTGDLEKSGQTALLATPACDTDFLLAPHHGSRKANPSALAAWAQPEHVIVSAGPRVDFKSLRAAYGPRAEILSTHDVGAVTFEIRPDGTLVRTTVRPIRPAGVSSGGAPTR